MTADAKRAHAVLAVCVAVLVLAAGALAVASYVAWEWRHDAAARAWWRRAVAQWRGHVWGA